MSLCLFADTKPVERVKLVDDTDCMVSVANIPAWRGTMPQVTNMIDTLAQKTAQCLTVVSERDAVVVK